MSTVEAFEPLFVDEMPEQLEAGKLYISIAFGSINHLCACGCGNEVVTPLHPARWAMLYDGDTVTLRPSVGSFGLTCRPHYVIHHNRVVWQPAWSAGEARAGAARDRRAMERCCAREPRVGQAHRRGRSWRRWLRR